MERSRDMKRTTISPINGLPTRRQRITTLRDSPEGDSQMKSQLKDRDRELSKRRRVDKSGVQQSFRDGESMESSDDEYYEQEQNRMNQPSPPSSSLLNSRRVLRTLRSAPVLRSIADEVIGVPIPRRARSASAKRLHEYRNSGSDGIGEKMSRRRFSPSPATAGLVGSGGQSSSCSGVSMKKKKKTKSGPKTRVLNSVSSSRLSLTIQDDIEIEVAEALFDLMKQSHSSKKQEYVDKDSTNAADDEIERLKAGDSKDENNAFSAQNEQSIKVNTETIATDSIDEVKKAGRIEKEKFPAQEQLVNKGKESVSPSCDKVNACDIQDPTVTKAKHAAAVIENKKETNLEIDFTAPPPLPSCTKIDPVVDSAIDPKFMTQDVQKKSATSSKDSSLSLASPKEKFGAINCNQQRGNWKEQKIQSPLPFPVGISGWPGAFSYPGYMPPPQAVLPIDGSTRSSTVTQLPQFKFSQPLPKRCATHQCIAHNIEHHLQLINKSICCDPPATLSETKKSSRKHKVVPENQLLGDIQNLTTMSGGSGKDKNSNVATDFTTASNILHATGFVFPFGQPQTTVIGNTSLPNNSAGKPSMSFNNSIFPSNEAASYMAMLQNNGCPFPISTNIPISSLKGSESPAMRFFNHSFYPSQAFNVSQNMNNPHKQPKVSENKYPTSAPIIPLQQPEKLDTEITKKNGGTVNNGPACSFPFQSMNFSMANKHSDVHQQGSKSRVDLIPQPFALSFGSNPSSLNFSSMAQNSAIFHNYQQKNFQKSGGSVSISNFLHNEQQLIQLRKHIADNSSSQLPQSSLNQTRITFGNSSIPAASFQGQQIVNNCQPSKDAAGTSRTSPTVGSTISALPSQQTEASVNGSSQKSSPTCRRNVPSILSTCASQLPELKN